MTTRRSRRLATANEVEALPRLDIRSGRVGDFQYMFDKGRESFIAHTQQLDDYSNEAQKIALSTRVVTEDDLRVLKCKDYDSAARLVFARNKAELGRTVNYASRELTQIPIELTLSPPIEQLHLGFNKLTILSRKFFRLPFLSELNLDQNMLTEVPKEFQNFSGLTILSLKVIQKIVWVIQNRN